MASLHSVDLVLDFDSCHLLCAVSCQSRVCVYLFGFESCEAEHADLVDDVLPVVRGALLLQTGHQLFPHLNDAVRHTMDLLQPVRRMRYIKGQIHQERVWNWSKKMQTWTWSVGKKKEKNNSNYTISICVFDLYKRTTVRAAQVCWEWLLRFWRRSLVGWSKWAWWGFSAETPLSLPRQRPYTPQWSLQHAHLWISTHTNRWLNTDSQKVSRI